MQKNVVYRTIQWLTIIILVFGCKPHVRESHKLTYQDLLVQVQMQQVFSDSKTFVDCTPLIPKDSILLLYQMQMEGEDFDLTSFVRAYYHLPTQRTTEFQSDLQEPVSQHITKLWNVLTRKDSSGEGTLLPLPYPYVVPGGRFNEIYYWDSYFTMLGLQADGRYQLIESMVKNFSYLINQHGFIPNGNRSYFLSRSQPPFFSLMVELLAEIKGDSVIANYLPELKKEYAYWMNGWDRLISKHSAINHVVQLEEGEILNRYWDSGSSPRPESFREDSLLSLTSQQEYHKLYRNIRSACESGWDFSSRWFRDQHTLQSIETTAILPVDLNVLLWNLEKIIAKGYSLTHKALLSDQFRQKAEARKNLIKKVFWSNNQKFFMDYNFRERKPTASYTLAGIFPLFLGLASQDQANEVANRIEKDFLYQYGLVTSLVETGQQWDSPNGWAPLQWITIKGLQKYGFNELAEKAARRWIQTNVEVYRKTGKLVEKYNVVHGLAGQGGEYPTQDGFGWTNGVLQNLMLEYPEND